MSKRALFLWLAVLFFLISAVIYFTFCYPYGKIHLKDEGDWTEYFGVCVSILGVFITSFFSHLIFKVSEKAVESAEKAVMISQQSSIVEMGNHIENYRIKMHYRTEVMQRLLKLFSINSAIEERLKKHIKRIKRYQLLIDLSKALFEENKNALFKINKDWEKKLSSYLEPVGNNRKVQRIIEIGSLPIEEQEIYEKVIDYNHKYKAFLKYDNQIGLSLPTKLDISFTKTKLTYEEYGKYFNITQSMALRKYWDSTTELLKKVSFEKTDYMTNEIMLFRPDGVEWTIYLNDLMSQINGINEIYLDLEQSISEEDNFYIKLEDIYIKHKQQLFGLEGKSET